MEWLRMAVRARAGYAMSVSGHTGASAPDATCAMGPVPHARRSVPSDGTIPTGNLVASLAARGVTLIDRQHEVLEALQRREEDPERLAGLYRLDHLAAQLRRNSNAALVLAGLPTIRGIDVPTMLSELVYAAVSEVDGYQRVTVGAFPTRRVRANAGSDLVHLLGDLLENALAVSPRTGGVWIRGERPQAGTGAPALVRVGDSGAAVSDADLGQLNDMLAGRACTTSSRGVGLVVTREIARRHCLTVHFRRLAGGGLVATVALPDALFETPENCSLTLP